MRHNLSDVTALIKDRRSFAPEQHSARKVHRDVVEEILRAGIWAPTHGMTQPWRFTVFQGEGLDSLRMPCGTKKPWKAVWSVKPN